MYFQNKVNMNISYKLQTDLLYTAWRKDGCWIGSWPCQWQYPRWGGSGHGCCAEQCSAGIRPCVVKKIVARGPPCHSIHVVVYVEIHAELVVSIPTHHSCNSWHSQGRVCGPVHLGFWQAMNTKHEIDKNETLHLTRCCLMPPCSGELQTQKLKSHLMRTQSFKFFSDVMQNFCLPERIWYVLWSMMKYVEVNFVWTNILAVI